MAIYASVTYFKVSYPHIVRGFSLLLILLGIREREGTGEEAEEMRSTVIRHALLSYTLCIREISERLRQAKI